jgi:CBS-domain-containing membrane protein
MVWACKRRRAEVHGYAVRHMEKLQVRRLPVINKSRRMVGILSLGDVSN